MLDFDMRYSPKYGLIQNGSCIKRIPHSYNSILGTKRGRRGESREERAGRREKRGGRTAEGDLVHIFGRF
jgi:hypothetical protein